VATELPPSTLYSAEYFLSPACDGLPEYLEGRVSVVKARELALLDVRPGDRVLDIGCGRGEVTAELLRRGALPTAVDYSADAVRLTKTLVGDQCLVASGDASHLPFPSGSFDRVLLGDVIEHIPWSLAKGVLREVDRVLATGGQALVHTSPNTWFITIVKPVLVVLLKWLHRQEVLDRFAEYDRLRFAMHPNELNPLRFNRLVREAGVPGRVWVDPDVLRSGSSEWTEHLASRPAVRIVGKLAGAWPLRLLLGNDMFAILTKTG
jgi:SAM-dependent methyltransferase